MTATASSEERSMPTESEEAVRTAQELAAQATTVARQLKAGTWEAVQALALASIAQSAAVLAARSAGD